jgi:hypothetical protein
MSRCWAACHAAINREDYLRPHVATVASVFSNIKVTPKQIAWLLNQFGALEEHSGEQWTIEVGPGVMDVVSVADGTDDLAPCLAGFSMGRRSGWVGGRSTALR